MQRMRMPVAVLAVALIVAGCGGSQESDTRPVRIATTTSTANSGLLDELFPIFESETGIRIDYVAVGTGKALKHGENGDVDAVLVHAPAAEEAFVAAGFGVARVPLMWNDFLVAGPPADPAEVAAAPSGGAALQRIAASGVPFISRGDDSGTHKKERQLWQATATEPAGNWYVEAGQGMGACLMIASEKEAYVLTDRGTYLAMRDAIDLTALAEGDAALINPYSIIAISADRYPDLNHAGARRLIDWLTSERGQELIGAFRVAGEQLFHPGTQP